MKKIIIFNSSFGTRELPDALISTLRRSLPYDYELSIESDCNDENSTYLMICPAGLRRSPPKNYIAWQLEFIGNKNENDPDTAKYFEILKGAKAVWDYSKYNIELLNEKNIKASYVPLGYNESLSPLDLIFDQYTYDDEERTTDVLFLCYCDAYPRRLMMRDLCKRKFKCSIFSDLDIEGMKREIRRAKICINVHVEKRFILEIVRLNILLSNQTCVISERSLEPDIDTLYSQIGVKFVDYDDMIPEIERLLTNFEERKRLAISSFQNYRKYRRWEEVVDFPSLLK